MTSSTDIPVVAFLGPAGTHSHRAASRLFGDGFRPLACPDFAGVFRSVEEGLADFGMLPIENNTAGTVEDAFNQLIRGRLVVVAEFSLPIAHALLSLEAGLEAIQRVYSLPHPYLQSSNFLSSTLPQAVWVQSLSSSQALEDCLANPRGSAAIGFADSGLARGLRVLHDNIQDREDNSTRFVVVAPPGRKLTLACPRLAMRTSVVFTLVDRPGSLYEVLGIFHRHRLNLCHIESRLARLKDWKYYFFLTHESPAGEQGLESALQEVESATPWCRKLGTYPVLNPGATA